MRYFYSFFPLGGSARIIDSSAHQEITATPWIELLRCDSKNAHDDDADDDDDDDDDITCTVHLTDAEARIVKIQFEKDLPAEMVVPEL